MSIFRALRQVVRVSTRSRLTSTARFSTVKHACPLLATPFSRAFSLTPRAFGSGATDAGLSLKLQQELEYETEAATSGTPDFIAAFNSQGIWRIEDQPGHDEVVLTRTFGQETIRLVFSIADIQSEPESLEGADGEEAEFEGTDADQGDYPIRVSLSITKANGPGALSVDMVAQEGQFLTENVSFYDNSQVATELTAEADWKRRGMYIGPQFESLDLGLQEEFDKFLQERGINESIALFIPKYAEFKEQTEYNKWLSKVKFFVDL